jgi:hypothetical protein
MKKSFLKKTAALVLCAVFILICVSCAAEQGEELAPEYTTILPGDLDLNNKTFVFGMVKDYFFEGKDSVLTYIYNTPFADLALKRIHDVESTLNCKIEFRYYDRASEAAYIDALSSTYRNDLIQEETYWLASYIPTGIFVDLALLDNIDVTNEEKWGNRELLLPSMWNGAVYGVVPALHPLRTQNSVSGIIGINEDYVKTMGRDDPRDYYENGQWTWDTFTDVLTNYTFTALSGDQVYSFASDASRFIRCVAFSNGDDFITYHGEDGTFELGLYTPTALTALNQYYEWMNGPTRSSMLVTTDTNAFAGINGLIEGTAVMGHLEAYQVLSNTDSIAYSLDNYGIVPYPSGPDVEPKYYKTYCESTDFTICIPVMARDPEATALVMNALYEPLEGYETKESIIEYLDKNYFLDTRDSALFYELADPDKTYFQQTTDGLYDIWPALIASSATEALAKYEEFLITRTEKYLLPHIVTAYEIYGD